MSHKEEFLDGQESALNELESGLSAPTLSLPGEESARKELEYDDLFPYLDVDDYVYDYRPNPDKGCRRTYKISSSGCRVSLGVPFGPTYVFVQGKDSACIVRSLKAGSKELPDVCYLERILKSLADLHFKGFKSREKYGDLKHFAVVSVFLSPHDIIKEMEIACRSYDHIHKHMDFVEGPGDIGIERFFFLHGGKLIKLLKETPSFITLSSEETAAVKMLQSKLKNKTPFTFDETIQTAISAIQCLYNVLFQDDEIEVYAVGEAGRVDKLLEREEIGWHLAAIKTSGGSRISEHASLALQLDMSSSRGEDLHPNARRTGSRGCGGILADGRCYSIPTDPAFIGKGDWVMDRDDDLSDPSVMKRPQKPAKVDSSPKHDEHTTTIRSTGSKSFTRPSSSGPYIFVQGKKSACIVTPYPVKDKETSSNLKMAFIGLADTRLTRPAFIRREFKENVDIHPCAVVTVSLDPDNSSEEKGFEPDSSHKDPASCSRKAAEESAINFLKHELENGRFDESIKTAIIALQYLYGENVKAHDITVYAFQDNKMDFLAKEEIERYLTVINNV